MNATEASLILMGEGMAGIFVVMFLIYISIKLLGKKRNKKSEEPKNQ